jgi:putative ABC transport system permease protein
MREIIGVVADIHNRALNTDPKPVYYLPQSQVPFSELAMVVKTSNDPHALVSAVTREVQAMDSELPVFSIKTMDEYVSSSVAAPRFNTDVAVDLRGVAPGTHHHRPLRGDELFGGATDERDWHSHGAGRTDARRARNDCERRREELSASVVAGHWRGALVNAAARDLLFGVTTRDPVTFLFIAVLLSARGHAGLLYSRIARHQESIRWKRSGVNEESP